MADYLPKFEGPFTLPASATVTGGRLVEVSGAGTVAPGTDDSAKVAGVAGFDVASGEGVTIFPLPGVVHYLVASGGITAGARVACDADGKVQTIGANTNPIGLALETASTNGDVIAVLGI